MGCQHKSSRSYYNLMKKELKKSYDKIIESDFNKNYSIQLKKFEAEKKKKIYLNDGEIIDWKSFLLFKFYVKKTSSWQYYLYNYIQNDLNYSNFQIYYFENQIFTEQFFLLSFPQFYLKDSDRLNEPILFLYEQNELKSSYKNQNKLNKKKEKEKRKEIEMKKINETDKNYQKKKIEEKMYLNISPSDTIIQNELNIDIDNLADEKVLNKFNSYKIREHINLIRKQLESINHHHPINAIIKKFAEFYSDILIKEFNSLQNADIRKIEKSKEKLVNEIKNFIEIISVALKLFYSKTVNYEFFVSERDEFFNLICYILFNEKKFYNSLFNLFNLSNNIKTENFQKKKKEFKVVTPKDAGISVQFRLDDETEKLKNNNGCIPEKTNKKKEIMTFLEITDISRSRYNSTFGKGDSKGVITSSFASSQSVYIKGSNIKMKDFNENVNKDVKENIDRKMSVVSFKEFTEKINSQTETLKEKIEINLDENPSQLDIPNFYDFDLENEKKMPYGKAIEYIQTMKDYCTPLDKLSIIALTSVLITESIDNFWKGKKIEKKLLNIDADELMSIYLYITYNMDLPSIYTELDFINYFTGSITKQSMIGYYYTTIEGCLNFIMSAKTKEDLNKKSN